jgi:hypothetical protein
MMWSAIIPIVGSVLEKIFPDPVKAQEAKLELIKLQQQGELAALDADLKMALGQMEVNKVEAANANLFVSGWRPAVGWVCVLGLAYTFLGQPLLAWASTIGQVPVPPELDLDALVTLLAGMLGLGGFRTFEKVKGVARQ